MVKGGDVNPNALKLLFVDYHGAVATAIFGAVKKNCHCEFLIMMT